MDFAHYFPIWDKMTANQQERLRACLLSVEGREGTICRFFEMDICLFSASCVMPKTQFDIFCEAERTASSGSFPPVCIRI